MADPQPSAPRTVALIPGDGIGPEIAHSVRRIFESAGVPIRWEVHEAGLPCVESHGTALPLETLDAVRRLRVALKGPTTTPIGHGHTSINVTLRKALGLFANVRPCRNLPGVATRYEKVDLIIVRENIEDLYGGIEHFQSPDVAQCLKVITRQGSTAVARYALEMARREGRRRVTCVQKANIMKLTDGLFLDCFRRVAVEYPDIQSDEMLVDNCCMQLVTNPSRFDVILTQNLYGDILSDLCAGLVGGLGVAPGGNIGDGCAVFEAVHGSAPDIAGKGLANPTALLLSGLQMLRYLGLTEDAERVARAHAAALGSGVRTRDLGGTASTSEFTDALIEALPARSAGVSRPAPTAVAPKIHSATTHSVPEWVLRGADVFVRCDSLPRAPERVGPLKVVLIDHRGVRVGPGAAPDAPGELIGLYRLRYVAEAGATSADVEALLAELSRHLTWVHVEKLHAERTPSGALEARYSGRDGQ